MHGAPDRTWAAVFVLLAGTVGCTGVITNREGGSSDRAAGSTTRGAPGSSSSPVGGSTPGAGPSGPGTPSTGSGATTEPRGEATFGCPVAPTTPPFPRRLWRLSPKQYANTIAVTLSGRRRTDGAPVALPAGLPVPLELPGEPYRFATYSGTHSISNFEFGQSVGASEQIAQKVVEAIKTGTCWATMSAADTCAATVIRERGEILFRRPLTGAEVDRYAGLVKANTGTFTRDEALAIAFQTMLLAPQFLFLAEIGDPVPGVAGVSKLNGYETAAAISYTLTDGPADAALWDAAAKGTLSTPEQIAAHVTRILQTPGAAPAREFVIQQFKLDRVLGVAKSIEKPGEYGRDRLLQDARMLADYVYTNNARKDFFKTLLTTPMGFAGADSYKVYGLAADPKSNAPQTLSATQRAGFLTQPAFLAGLAAFEETLPIKRGRFINESVLCRPIPDAPLDVVTKLPASMSTAREKLAVHSKEPRCSACHAQLDPVGLALERYDAYGRYRTTQYNKPIDPSGTLSGFGDADGPFMDAVQLTTKLASSSTTEQCLIRHGFRYFMGRPEDAYDSCTLDAALKAYRASGGDFVAAVAAFFTSASLSNRS